MIDLAQVGANLKMPLGDIGAVERLVHQYVIPGLIFRRPTRCHLLVPLLAQFEFGVDAEHHAAIAKVLVRNDLANEESRVHW